MQDEAEFEIDESFLLPANSGPAKMVPSAYKRKFDPTLFRRGQELAAKFHERFTAELALELGKFPELSQGLKMSISINARAKSTSGAYKVLFSLIDVVLGPHGATSTQEECRATVQTQYPQMAISKDWTKPLPAWALARAKSRVPMMRPDSPVVIKNGMSLRDLHNAVRIAAAKSGGKSRSYRPSVTVLTDAILVNGVRFKISINKSNGREYAFARMKVDTLETALTS